jgi:hypothetical protein
VRGWSKDDFRVFFSECFSGYTLRDFGGANFYPLPPVLARPLAAMLPNLAWGIFMRWEKTRPYGREFLDYPISRKLETNFFVG